jgi:FkbM family methyltransferase
MNYSQNQEQQAILNYFKDFKGSFLSLGENDGKTLSNVRALAELGWCGVMVEPSPKVYHKLKLLYENTNGCFYTYQCAIGITNGKAILHDSGELLKTGDQALVSTMVEKEMDRFKSVLKYEDVEVKVYRWKTFLNRLKIKKFEFVNIDCEGLDADILEQMDVSEVKCLCIEWNGVKEMKQRFDKHMAGFNIIYTSGENLIYAR